MREFKQPRRRRQQERDKFAYLTMKNNSFARFARAVFIWTFGRHSRSFHHVKRSVLHLCGRRKHMMANVQLYFLTSEA